MTADNFIDFYQNKHDEKNVIQDRDFYYFYKHITVDANNYVFGIFDNNELKYNYAVNFNDPYDTASRFNLNLDNIPKNHIESTLGEKISDEEWPAIKEAFTLHLGEVKKTIKPQFDKIISDAQKKTPITCFNAHPLSILMWSHYAQNHSGFMLEFKIPKDYSSKLMLLPIEYSNELPEIDLDFEKIQRISESDDINFDFVKKLLLHKAKCWSYEKEYRAFGENDLSKNNPLLIKFDPHLLSSVVIGTKFKETGKFDLLTQKLSDFNNRNNLNVGLYETRLYEDRYELTVDGHPRLSEENFKGS